MSVAWPWAGARWWKFDFHTHTPKSDGYGKGPDQEVLKQRTAKEWLLDYMRAGVDCVAVTDHNTGAWIDDLKAALEELKKEKYPDYRTLYLFPGVEISVNGGIHILAVLPPEKRASDIDTLLGAVGFNGEKGGTNHATTKSPIEVISEIINAGGLAIPAHADQEKGLFKLPGTSLRPIFNNDQIIAMELCDQSAQKPQLYRDNKLEWAEILGSDAHHPAGLKSPGSHFSWVKMGTPSFEGLRLALLDGPLSIKRSDSFKGDPNAHGHLGIESMTVNDAQYIGRGKTFECRFNPWLNAIIGGRGTGKSTLIEFLRLTLRRDKELPDALKDDFNKYQQDCETRHDDGLLTRNAKLVAVYRKDDAEFRIQWSFDGGVEPILEATADGNWQAVQGEIAQRFPVRIYSQKQIFELAKRPQALLSIVDDAPEVRIREWAEKWNELQTRFFSLRAQAREIEAGLNEEPRITGELDDIMRKLAVFEKAGHADVLKTFQRRQRQLRALEYWEESWNNSGVIIRDLSKTILPEDIDKTGFDLDRGTDTACLTEVQNVAARLNGICRQIDAIASDIDQLAAAWKQTKKNLEWTKAFDKAFSAYEQLREQLADVGAGDPSEYGRLVQQRQSLEERLKAFGSRRKNLDALKIQTKECLNKLNTLRKDLTDRRSRFFGAVLKDNPYVSIKIIPFGNKDTVENEFREMINQADGDRFKRDIGSVDSEEGVVAELYQNYSFETVSGVQDFEQKLDDLKTHIRNIRSGDESSVRDHRFAVHIQGLPPENVDRLECWFPEDSLEVLYSVKQGGEFKAVQQGSPGQKTAALLAFILSYGDEPLILDQPEDDLDNHLIYDLIVTQLREIKQKRQVIVVTHNANIVVNGDAENVTALGVRAGQTRIVCQGSLQETEIRNEICRVMEGGKKAFNLRYKRIGEGGKHV
ncbi:TrlF family AAA-like ATPase [Devosia sp.]|uniref:TrlF family AAA-like ATPase n=1 Tax=Devosia sp. TaxID=1871048 RepID=UPI0027371EC9|nr:AAA family ATPase [Devosia sp.]MDP2782292.1 AAA family ATPase [Devosia sp.]